MRPRSAFTLIEVVGATAAFVIAFLASTAAFAMLLRHEMANYHRTLAGIAAMRWAKGTPSITDLTSPPNMLIQKDDPLKPGDPNFAAWYFGDPASDPSAVFLGRYHMDGVP